LGTFVERLRAEVDSRLSEDRSAAEARSDPKTR
jgi:hypothetical protein